MHAGPRRYSKRSQIAAAYLRGIHILRPPPQLKSESIFVGVDVLPPKSVTDGVYKHRHGASPRRRRCGGSGESPCVPCAPSLGVSKVKRMRCPVLLLYCSCPRSLRCRRFHQRNTPRDVEKSSADRVKKHTVVAAPAQGVQEGWLFRSRMRRVYMLLNLRGRVSSTRF